MKIYIAFSNHNAFSTHDDDEEGGCCVIASNADNCYIEYNDNALSAISVALEKDIKHKNPHYDFLKCYELSNIAMHNLYIQHCIENKSVIACANAYLRIIRKLFSHVMVRSC